MSSSHTRRSDVFLAVHNLGYTLPSGCSLFDNLTIGFGRERTGLVGRNGVGKSTLARLLVGSLVPTSGSVIRHGTVAYLDQHRAPHTHADHALHVGDLLGQTVAGTLERIGLAHVSPRRLLHTLSGGERSRVALAHTLLGDPDFVVLDEPTNDLDAHSRQWLYHMIDASRCGMLIISHDRALLGRMDRIVDLSERGATLYGGGFTLFEEQRALREAAERDTLAHAEAALKKAHTVARETRERQERRSQRGKKSRLNSGMPKILLGMRKESSEKTTARLQRTNARVVDAERARRHAAKLRVDQYSDMAMSVPSAGLHRSRSVLEVAGVSHSHHPVESPQLAFPDFTITGPERLAIVGNNGTGKSTLLRLITGAIVPRSGTICLGVPHSRVAYLDQHLALLDPQARVLDNLLTIAPGLTEHSARQLLARYKFRGDKVRSVTATLSGGERLRVALAATFEQPTPPQLLVMDEPTNHLDLDSLRVVESALREYDGALVMVSHDADFLKHVGVERVVSLRSP